MAIFLDFGPNTFIIIESQASFPPRADRPLIHRTQQGKCKPKTQETKPCLPEASGLQELQSSVSLSLTALTLSYGQLSKALESSLLYHHGCYVSLFYNIN